MSTLNWPPPSPGYAPSGNGSAAIILELTRIGGDIRELRRDTSELKEEFRIHQGQMATLTARVEKMARGIPWDTVLRATAPFIPGLLALGLTALGYERFARLIAAGFGGPGH